MKQFIKINYLTLRKLKLFSINENEAWFIFIPKNKKEKEELKNILGSEWITYFRGFKYIKSKNVVDSQGRYDHPYPYSTFQILEHIRIKYL